ncbi:SH3 domain-containing protein [Herpetosiphon llansteffanensis]|uniref:SH3 domain-containing protein n=1 Tax=Herpetosiphon llansteffanensis TaxID=2094568 RepID=UPI000D7C234D|nr:SH3 domain-containing protein [Herpetosiphon llansteffanensis]
MSQVALTPRSQPTTVWQLRRKKVPDQLSLPADYVPTDYTSLPTPEEPKKGGGLGMILVGLVLLLVLGAVAYGVISQGGDPEVTPTPVAQTTLDIERASMIVSDGKLTAQINISTDAPDNSQVGAILLEDGRPFEFFDTAAMTSTVAAGKARLTIPEIEDHEDGRKSSEYTVQVTVANAEGAVLATANEPIEIKGDALDRFLGDAAVTPVDVTPTVESTEPVSGTVVPTPADGATPVTQVTPPVQPTAAAGGVPVPLDNVVISRPGIIYTTPYGPANQRGNVTSGEIARIVVKMPVNGEVWYLVAISQSGQSGWLNSSTIDLPASEVNKITPVSGDAPFAVTFNGGNVRSAPGADVVTTVDAGINLTLTGRSSDSAWFKVKLPDGTEGWVAGQILTINPAVLNTIPVAP